MLKAILKPLLSSVLLIALQACVPGAITPDPDSINTVIAQTIAVAQTRTSEPGVPVTGDESPTLTPSPEPPSATQTPSATLIPTPIFTSTSAVPEVSVSVSTNCRIGPGVVYARVGGLLVGEVAEVVGRHTTRDYWIIRNPDRPGEPCWLWGRYATLTGNTSLLPIYTPPPTPTPSPDFTASYHGLDVCAGTGWWLDIELENPKGITFNSISMTVRDTVNDTVLSLYSNDFTDRNGCNETNTWDSLPAGEERLVSTPFLAYNPTGHRLRATIILCSNLGQSGTCTSRVIEFTP
jgi:hypothetical protein